MSRITRALMLSWGVSLLAPAVVAAQGIYGGVKGGISFSDLSNLRETLDAPSDVDINMRIGIAVGPFVGFDINDRFAFQPEVLFVTKGATASANGELRIKLNYIDVPILARITPVADNPFYLLFGPSVNFNVSAKAEEANGTTDEEDIKDDVKTTEFGLVLGAGVSIRNFLVEGRYIAGLTNIADDPDFDETVRNRGFAILAGVRF